MFHICLYAISSVECKKHIQLMYRFIFLSGSINSTILALTKSEAPYQSSALYLNLKLIVLNASYWCIKS